MNSSIHIWNYGSKVRFFYEISLNLQNIWKIPKPYNFNIFKPIFKGPDGHTAHTWHTNILIGYNFFKLLLHIWYLHKIYIYMRAFIFISIYVGISIFHYFISIDIRVDVVLVFEQTAKWGIQKCIGFNKICIFIPAYT